MKRILSIAVALVATITAGAQNIAVVNSSNTTKIYQTLDEAITNAEAGSIIYIPGGGYALTDNAKINKKLTIMGVSHRGDTDNVDGATVISGNLNFISGSSHSAVMGVFVSGNVVLTDSIANFTMRYCNVNSVQVKSSKSGGMIINQCYIRNNSNYGNCNVHIENCIFHSAWSINGGIVNHNIITSYKETGYGSPGTLNGLNSTTITNNCLLNPGSGILSSSNNCIISHNCVGTKEWGDNPIVLEEGQKWENVFENYDSKKAISIVSKYKLTTKWGKGAALDGTDLGIYGGSGFSDTALAPIPRIVSKKVSEQTDGSGKLQIEVTVKAQ